MEWRDLGRFALALLIFSIMDVLWYWLFGDKPNHTADTILASAAMIVMAIREKK